MALYRPFWLVTLLSLASAAPVLAQRAVVSPTQRTISTTGDAMVMVVPDEVIVYLGVATHAPELKEAKAQNDADARSMLKAIRDLGIDESQIQADNIQVTIRYDNDDDEPIKIIGYLVRRDYAITLKDITRLEPVLDAALSSGANFLEGVDYRTTRLRELRDRAREMAAVAAREKAEAIAKTLKTRVGLPVTVNEGSTSYLAGWSRRDRRGGMAQNVALSVGGDAAAAGETVPLGQIAIHATISTVFELDGPAGS